MTQLQKKTLVLLLCLCLCFLAAAVALLSRTALPAPVQAKAVLGEDRFILIPADCPPALVSKPVTHAPRHDPGCVLICVGFLLASPPLLWLKDSCFGSH